MSIFQATMNIILNNQLLRLTMRQEYSYTHIYSIHTFTKTLASSSRQNEEIKYLLVGKEELKLSLFQEAAYVENLKEF